MYPGQQKSGGRPTGRARPLCPRPRAFDRSTILLAELVSSQAAVLLGYARQVETLGEAVHARQDIGTAVGTMMERYGLDHERAFSFLVRISNNRNVRLRFHAHQIIDGSFEATAAEQP